MESKPKPELGATRKGTKTLIKDIHPDLVSVCGFLLPVSPNKYVPGVLFITNFFFFPSALNLIYFI
jgi:hypothetical protein